MVHDRHLLRVLDADKTDGLCFVVNEWGSGDSLDIMLANEGPLGARRAAWLVSEVAASIAEGHAAGVAHGRLVPENVLVDHGGAVRLIGFAVDAAMHGLPPGRPSTDVSDHVHPHPDRRHRRVLRHHRDCPPKRGWRRPAHARPSSRCLVRSH